MPSDVCPITGPVSVGAHGALALMFSVMIRWQALVELQGDTWLRAPAACGIARASMVLLATLSRPAGDGLGAADQQPLAAFQFRHR